MQPFLLNKGKVHYTQWQTSTTEEEDQDDEEEEESLIGPFFSSSFKMFCYQG